MKTGTTSDVSGGPAEPPDNTNHSSIEEVQLSEPVRLRVAVVRLRTGTRRRHRAGPAGRR